MRKLDKIIVHCSDTPNDMDVGVDFIKKCHTSPDPTDPTKPWSDIGYHYVIERNGQISEGRDLSKIGSHCKGKNTGSIGVCLIGMDKFTEEQYYSLKLLCDKMKEHYNVTNVYGHRDFDKRKTCPNFEVKDLL
jgi:N-acetylmuramoyl-L-alanine amidase